MKNKWLTTLVILMMLLVPVSVSGTYENKSNSSYTLNLTDLKQETSFEPEVAQNPYFEGEAVIFAENGEEYQELILHPALVQKYDFLEAVKLDPTHQQFNELTERYGTLAPASLFYETIPIPSTGVESPEGIGLDDERGIDKLNLQPMYDLGFDGTGVVVGVLDDGVDFSHPALSGSLAGSTVAGGAEGVACDKGHGTPVAGTVAARPVSGFEDAAGSAPGANIYSVEGKCVTVDGQEGLTFDTLSAFNTFIANNDTLKVINTSLGTISNVFLNDFVRQAEDANIVLVGSAGNDGGPRSIDGGYGNTVYGISVAASTFADNRASFSSVGPGLNFLQKPDVIAPGVNVIAISPGSQKVSISGTSFSSPMVAGGVAVLIDALLADGTDYNVGLVKAAIMREAVSLGLQPNQEGFGQPDIKASFDLINTLTPASDGIPQIVEITPKAGPTGTIETIPQGGVYDAYYTIISSHPLDTTVSVTGGLAGITSVSSLIDQNSQQVKFSIDTSSLTPGTTLTGGITVENGDDSTSATFSLEIGEPFKGKVLLDGRHTYWDDFDQDRIDGSNTGEMAKIAISSGWIVEESSELITPSLLSNYNVLWLPDSFNMIVEADGTLSDSGISIEAEEFLLQSEIDAIHNFVENGGNILMDFNGLFTTDLGPNLNVTAQNALLNEFDIFAVDVPIAQPSGQGPINIANRSSLVQGMDRITHFGNYLEVGEKATAVTQDAQGRISTAIYTDQNSGGRVLVTSTNFWMDNFGALGRYENAGNDNDVALSNRVWDWFDETNKISMLSHDITQNSVSAEFKILDGNSASSATPSVFIKGTPLFDDIEITPTSLGNGEYSASYDITGDGVYELVIAHGTDYIALEQITVDNTAPEFSFNEEEGQANGTVLSVSSNYIIEVTVSDAIDELNKNLINMTYEGELIETQEGYDVNTKIYRAFLPADVVGDHVPLQEYYVEISAKDNSGNIATAVVMFYIGEGPDNSSPTPTPSPTPTASDEDSPFNSIWMMLALFNLGAIAVLKRRNKN